MTAHPRFGLRAVSLAAPRDPRLAREIGLEPLPDPAAPAETAAPGAPVALPRRTSAATRATLAVLVAADRPMATPEVRALIDRPDLAENTVFCILGRLSEWGFASHAPGGSGAQRRTLWRVTAAGRAFHALCRPVSDAEILAAVAALSAIPWPSRTARWWGPARTGQPARPTTATTLADHFAAQGNPGALDPAEAAERLNALARAGHLTRAEARRKGALVACFWPA